MAFYYPEGNFGPVCDVILPETATADYLPSIIRDTEVDVRIPVASSGGDWGWDQDLFPGLPRFKEQRCKQREDGSFYDCEYIYDRDNPYTLFPDGPFPGTWNFAPSFFVPTMGPGACSDWDPDINIKPLKFFTADGTEVTKYKVQRSTPVTYPVVSRDIDNPGNDSYWSEEGNKFAVWVNPEQCTLPRQIQEVTYQIPIPATDTYTITGGADDTFSVFLDDISIPLANFNNVSGGIFAGGSYATPYSQSLTLNAGTLTLSVRCTNSDAGFVGADGQPEGLAYNWGRNPGGWYLKICRGTECFVPAPAPWVKSGPHQTWASHALLNEYAVYPSNTAVLSGTPHTATSNIMIETAGNYELEVACDDTASFTWDGVSIGSIASKAASTININNVSTGPHVLGVTVTNTTFSQASNNVWSKNPGGVAYRLKAAAGSSNVNATFSSNGSIVTTGSGSREFVLDFEWSDNPNAYSTALGTYTAAGQQFVQDTSRSSGETSRTVVLQGGQTYNATIVANSGGFVRENNNTRLCFRDLDGNDCNAKLDITAGAGVDYVATSFDLTLGVPSVSNLIWSTRDAVGYKLTESASEGGY